MDNTIEDLKKVINIKKIIGNPKDHFFNNAMPIDQANDYSIVWIKSGLKNYKEIISNSKAKIIICDSNLDFESINELDKIFIIVENPKLEFTKTIKYFFVKEQIWLIHESAIIHPEAILKGKVFIGPNTYIGKSTIEEGTVIHGNCFIYDNVYIGNNVKINANTVIGSEGFGYAKNENGEFEHFPHIGGVIIEDNVDIGSNTSIDRGSLGNTIIKTGVKIDNLVHIAHNVVIGKHSVVIANSMIGGSVIIDDYSWISPSVSLINQIKIGKNTLVGMGAVVTKNIPDNETWVGSPAKIINEFVEQQKKLKNL